MVFEKVREILCDQLDVAEEDVTLESNIVDLFDHKGPVPFFMDALGYSTGMGRCGIFIHTIIKQVRVQMERNTKRPVLTKAVISLLLKKTAHLMILENA